MKKLFILALLVSSQAQAASLCQSTRDPGFRYWVEGTTCPYGYYIVAQR